MSRIAAYAPSWLNWFAFEYSPRPMKNFKMQVVDLFTDRVYASVTINYIDEDELEQQVAAARRSFERKNPRKVGRYTLRRVPKKLEPR